MPRYIIEGELRYWGRVLVTAPSIEEAKKKAAEDEWDEVWE